MRDQSLILALLQEHNLASEQVAPRLQILADELSGRRGLSTQERNALFLAGRFQLAQDEGDWQAAVLVAGQQQVLLDGAHAGLRLSAAQLSGGLALQRLSGAPLYGQLTLSGYPSQPPQASGEHMRIERDYLSMDGKPLDISQLSSGDLVLVHLAVRGDYRVSDALVVDLLPAGLELENQNLAQSAASLQDVAEELGGWLQSMQSESRIQHQEFRGDRYVAAVDLYGYSTTHLLYLARAVTPGSYRVPPPQVESMYRPEWRAQGNAPERMVVRP